MKRDMDLVREMLLAVEECERFDGPGTMEIEGRDESEVTYHVKLLRQAGLLEVLPPSSNPYGASWSVIGLTWQGHEFLDAARNDTTWRKALGILQRAGVGATKELLVPLLLNLGRQQLGLA